MTKFLFIIYAVILCSCTSMPRSKLIKGSEIINEWQDTIKYVLPSVVSIKNEKVERREIYNIKTSEKRSIKDDESSGDVKDALGSAIESNIRISGHEPLLSSYSNKGLYLVVNSFMCKSSYEYTQQIVYATNQTTKDFDGSSFYRSQKCSIILSQISNGQVISKRNYYWDDSASDNFDFLDKSIQDFTKLEEK